VLIAFLAGVIASGPYLVGDRRRRAESARFTTIVLVAHLCDPMFPDWLVRCRDAHAGAVHRPAWSFERKYDGIPADQLQGRRRRSPVLAQPPPAGSARDRRRESRAPDARLILDGELDWDGGEYHVFDLLWHTTATPRLAARRPPRRARHAAAARADLARHQLADATPWERAASRAGRA